MKRNFVASLTNIVTKKSKKQLMKQLFFIFLGFSLLVFIGISISRLVFDNKKPPINQEYSEILLQEEVKPDGLSSEELKLSYMVRAEQLVQAGDTENAKKALEKVILDNSEDYRFLIRLSNIHAQVGNQETAKDLLDKASAKVMSSKDVAVHIQAYELFGMLQRDDLAKKHRERALELDENAVAERDKLQEQTFDDGPT